MTMFVADRRKALNDLDRMMGRTAYHPALRYSHDYTPGASTSVRETFLALGGKIVERAA